MGFRWAIICVFLVGHVWLSEMLCGSNMSGSFAVSSNATTLTLYVHRKRDPPESLEPQQYASPRWPILSPIAVDPDLCVWQPSR